jgi:hypothetical protein
METATYATYATFAKGETVRATMNTTYLKAGETYTVFRFSNHDEVTARVYWVADNTGSLWSVRNGHITLEAVSA